MALLVLLSHPERDAALLLARELVELGLAAGVNLLDGAASIYRWQGEVREKRECLILAQVAEAALTDFRAHVLASHPYQVPGLMAWPLSDAYPPFLHWIEANSAALAGPCQE